MSETIQYLVVSELQRAGLEAKEPLVQSLLHYIHLLSHWGKRINLTANPDPQLMILRHLPDAFFLAAYISSPSCKATSFADIGTGAGIPGLILALLCPHLQVHLVESNIRKCSFLRTAAFDLSLDLSLVEGRIEEISLPDLDLVCSRATWPPLDWLNLALSLIRPGKEIVAFLTNSKKSLHIPESLRMSIEINYALFDGTKRALAFYERKY